MDARPPHDATPDSATPDSAMPDSHGDARTIASDDAGMDGRATIAGASLAALSADDSSTDPAQPPEHEVEGAVPPGYDWPTHGGYLGCLVGTIAACLLTGFFGANLFSYFYIAQGWPFPVFALLTLVLFMGAVVSLGQVGWRLGRRFYRYYPQPKPTWGEDDEAAAELAPVRATRTPSSGQGAPLDKPVSDAAVSDAADSSSIHATDTDVVMQPGERDALVEGRERQDDGRDGGGEAADQAENAYQEPQRS